MAMMPHPERASFVRQMPDISPLKNNAAGNASAMEKPTNALNLFYSMKQYIEEEVL
jgi:phosphoribosylformylglycinamidine (FGAM) synthase-like amidotransferase family enzyme